MSRQYPELQEELLRSGLIWVDFADDSHGRPDQAMRGLEEPPCLQLLLVILLSRHQ